MLGAPFSIALHILLNKRSPSTMGNIILNDSCEHFGGFPQCIGKWWAGKMHLVHRFSDSLRGYRHLLGLHQSVDFAVDS